jgi:eukaryotic-like serine/threonine-protein kinase
LIRQFCRRNLAIAQCSICWNFASLYDIPEGQQREGGGWRKNVFAPANDHFSYFDPNLPNPGAGNLPGAVAFAGSGPGGSALSSDGKVLLFYEGGFGGGVGGSTYIRTTDGAPGVRLGEGLPQALSPDGTTVLSHLYLQTPSKLVLYRTGAGDTTEFELSGLEYDGGAEWLPNGKEIVFQAHESGHASRVFKKELPGGKPIAITPEIRRKGPVSPDGRLLLLFSSDRKAFLYQLKDGQPIAIKSGNPSSLANVIGWSADSHSLYVSDQDTQDTQSARIYRFDPFTGRQQDWKVLRPPDPAGVVGFTNIVISPNGKSYVFGYNRLLTELYLVEGLQH